MNATFENSGHSFTESGFCHLAEHEPLSPKQDNCAAALKKLLQLHEREMVDDSITIKEWQDAVKNGKLALENLTFKK